MIQAPWERRRAPSPWVSEPELATGISVVVPVYRSAETLRELVRRLTETVGGLGEPYEIILVEDCSPDRSWSVISDLARDDQRVRGVQLSRNYGQHNAILCGIRAARFDRTVTLDDDLQNPPEEIPTLLKDIQTYVAKEKLTGKHLRLASSTTAAINRLESGDEREAHFATFGQLFAKSSDKELVRYGKKLAKKPKAEEAAANR